MYFYVCLCMYALLFPLGIIQEFIVELLPQSPFLSLKTSLFDAVADLNNQSIFPSKENLREYLRKHYPEVKLPEIKHVHECLGLLIKERRLYHNGRGYFIICNENVLNDLKLFNKVPGLYHSSAASTQIKGFTLNSTVTTSSSPGVTDLEVNACSLNTCSLNTSHSAEASTGERGFPSSLETNRNGNNLIKNFFKKHVKTIEKQDINEETSEPHSVDKSVSIIHRNAIPSGCVERNYKNCDTPPVIIRHVNFNKSPSCIKHEKIINRNISKPNKRGPCCNDTESFKTRNCNHENNVKLHSNKYDNEVELNVKCIRQKVKYFSENGSHNVIVTNGKSKLKRSQSLEDIDGKIEREIRFAIVRLPTNQESDETNEVSYFKRSHSLGVGSSKSFNKRPQDHTNVKTCTDDQDGVNRTGISSYNSNVNSSDITTVSHRGTKTIGDSDSDGYQAINRDNSFSFTYGHSGYNKENFHCVTDLDNPPELLYNYENLGSSISFHKNNQTEYSVVDLSSPPKSTSLAEELREVRHVNNK